GRERYRLYRTAQGGAWEDEIPVAANDPAGTWQVSVRELISGRQYDGEFEVAGAAPKLAETVLPRPTEILVDRQAIADFLKAKPELTIALSRDQARLRGLADKLLQAVNGAGAKAKIAWADELVTGNNYRAVWMQDPYRPVYQIKGHLVLLGTARDNFLIRELQESGILLRATSPAYPGPGGFIIELVRSAFYGDDNAILVMAEDDAALAKAADRLLALTGGYDPTASLEAARRNLLPADYRRTLKDAPVPATAGTRQEPPTKQIALKAADVVQPVLRRGESIRCLAASADGSMIVAGTDGYFDNLIALSGTGKLLWKAHLADRFIHQLAASADGKVVAAATTFPIRVHVLDGKGKLIRQYDNLQYGRWGAKFTTLYSENQYMAMSPDGTRIVLPERDQKLACYAIADGKKLWEIPYKPENGKFRRFAHSLAFAPDSSTVAAAFITCSTDPKIIEQHMKVAPELMDDATKAEDRQLKPRLWIVDARAGSLASEKIEDPASDPRMLYWDEWMSEYTRFLGTPRTDLPMERLTRLPGVLGEDIAFAANKVAVACGGMPCGGAFVYDRAADTRASFHGLESAVRLSPDGKLVGGFNGSDLIVYDTATGNHWRAGAHEAVSDARISNDQVAACWWDGSLKVFSSKGDLLWQRDVGAGSVILATPAGWVVGNNLGSLRLFDPKGKEKWAADLNTIAIPEQAPAPRAKRSLPEKTEKRIVLQAKDVSLQTRPWGDISQAITGLDVAVAKDKLQFAFDAPWTGRFALSPSLVQGEGFGKVTVEVDGKAVGEMPLRAAGEVGPADGLKPLSVALQKGKHSVAISAAAGKSVGVEFVSLDAITRDVRSWLVLGPFDNPSIKFYDEGYADGPRKNFDEEQPVEKEIKDGKIDAAKVFTGKKNREVKWLRTADVQGSVDAASGWINLWAMLKVDGNMDLGYAAATVQSPEELTLATWWMWNHGLKIFANGAPVFGERTGNPPGGGGKLRRIDLPLRKGLNQILVKTDIGGVWWQEWGFSVQAAQVEGVEFRLPQ
ncbi:MAG TPA: PQQ-binding-like beta-propeller repeat protein, partial [Planctomycetota bacterium]|nr:PQQ-binding-like beta-propeller repeat protein [Planctomycetota bacterium]